MSGIMTLGRTMPPKFKNKHVLIYGTLYDRNAFGGGLQGTESAGLINYCDSPKIILISKMVIDAPN